MGIQASKSRILPSSLLSVRPNARSMEVRPQSLLSKITLGTSTILKMIGSRTGNPEPKNLQPEAQERLASIKSHRIPHQHGVTAVTVPL